MSAVQSVADAERIDELVRRLKPRLIGVLRRHSIPAQDAEDVLQGCLLALLRQWPTIESPEAWLFAALRNGCLMYWRTRRRQRWRLTDDGELDHSTRCRRPGPEDTALCSELIDFWSELSETHQHVLRLRFGLGLRPVDIARVLGYRASGISTVIRRACDAWLRAAGAGASTMSRQTNCDPSWPRSEVFDAGTVEAT